MTAKIQLSVALSAVGGPVLVAVGQIAHGVEQRPFGDVREDAPRSGSMRATYTWRRKLFDAIAAANFLGLLLAEIRAFPGAGLGFRIYGVIVLSLFVAVWFVLRRYEYPVWAMAALQLALIGHLAGRAVLVGGAPLYRAELLGLPMDKVIHAFNSAAAAAFVTALFDITRLRLGAWRAFVVIMVVAGLGAMIEIIEYVGTLLLPVNWVGDYANNMQDLIANLIGAAAGFSIAARVLHLAMPDAHGELPRGAKRASRPR